MLLWDGSWRNHCLHRRSDREPRVCAQTRSEQQHPCTGMASTPFDHRGCSLCRWTLLVRMDWIRRWQDSMDCTYTFRPLHWVWHLHYLPLLAQLHRRRLSHVRRLRSCSKHIPSIRIRCRLSLVRDLHV